VRANSPRRFSKDVSRIDQWFAEPSASLQRSFSARPFSLSLPFVGLVVFVYFAFTSCRCPVSKASLWSCFLQSSSVPPPAARTTTCGARPKTVLASLENGLDCFSDASLTGVCLLAPQSQVLQSGHFNTHRTLPLVNSNTSSVPSSNGAADEGTFVRLSGVSRGSCPELRCE
jgi:hypothetical protein